MTSINVNLEGKLPVDIIVEIANRIEQFIDSKGVSGSVELPPEIEREACRL